MCGLCRLDGRHLPELRRRASATAASQCCFGRGFSAPGRSSIQPTGACLTELVCGRGHARAPPVGARLTFTGSLRACARGGDFDTKTRMVKRFLEEGHKVKITIMFRGREVAHPELGMKILERIQADMGALAKLEAVPRLDGRNMTMVLAPEKKAPTKAERLDQADKDRAQGTPGEGQAESEAELDAVTEIADSAGQAAEAPAPAAN